MKILVLHLSDSHMTSFDNRGDIKKIDALVKSLNVVGSFQECIIVFSGDLANKGQVDEYKNVGYLFGNIINKIKKSFLPNKIIHRLIVPGNHDYLRPSNVKNRKDVENLYLNNSIDNSLLHEMKNLKEFFDFAEYNRCFLTDKIIDKKIIRFGEFKIQANLINTACFCDVSDSNGIHYIPERYIEVLSEETTTNLVISVMHHGIDWFMPVIKEKLEKVLYEKSSIVFLGHEHYTANKEIRLNGSGEVYVSAASAYSSKEQQNKSEFSAIIVDTEKFTMDTYSFNWDFYNNIYEHVLLLSNHAIRVIKSNNVIEVNKDFIKFLEKDDKRSISDKYSDYFVFPRLLEKKDEDKYSEDVEITDSNSFINEIKGNKCVFIEGNENSGKTTLLKHLFVELSKTSVPLFFSFDDIRGKKFERVIKNGFEDQYSTNDVDYKRFLQTDKNDLIAIIDDADRIDKYSLEKFIEFLSDKFGSIILCSKLKWDLNIVENLKFTLDSTNKFTKKFEISGYYSEKRKELIGNICKIKRVDKENMVAYIEKINKTIKANLKFFELDPNYIIQYTEYFLDAFDTFENSDSPIFNKVFEASITNAIKKHCKGININVIYIILADLAYFMHFNKKRLIKYSDFEKLISSYSQEHNYTLKPKEFIAILENAKILRSEETEDEIKFCNNSHLSFFVAKALNKKYQIDQDDSNITWVLKNICFGINGDVILFLSYITDNPKILDVIYTCAYNHMNEWEEYDIKKGNIKFLNNLNLSEQVKVPTVKDEERNKELETKAEIHSKEDTIIEATDIYDFDENDVELFDNKIKNALKFTEMLSKILPNFKYLLGKEKQVNLIDSIYKYPNKIIFQCLKDIDDNFEDIVTEIKDFTEEKLKTKNQTKKIDKCEISIMLEEMVIGYVLTLFNCFANISTEKDTIGVLSEYNFRDSLNYKIQNIMMLENIGYVDDFTKSVESLYKNCDMPIVRIMIKKIVRKCIVCNKMEHSKRQKLLDAACFDSKEEITVLLNNFKKTI